MFGSVRGSQQRLPTLHSNHFFFLPRPATMAQNYDATSYFSTNGWGQVASVTGSRNLPPLSSHFPNVQKLSRKWYRCSRLPAQQTAHWAGAQSTGRPCGPILCSPQNGDGEGGCGAAPKAQEGRCAPFTNALCDRRAQRNKLKERASRLSRQRRKHKYWTVPQRVTVLACCFLSRVWEERHATGMPLLHLPMLYG